MAASLRDLFSPLGSLETLPSEGGGPHLHLPVEGLTPNLAPVLVLCHFDTVWPTGTLAERPFRVDTDGRAHGPGVFDMKGGIVLLHAALSALKRLGLPCARPVDVLFTSDEEVGSGSSRSFIQQHARAAVAALIPESPLPGGMLKTARKGTADYTLTVEGRAAHAGVEPEKGINALQELALQIPAIHKLADPGLGTTVTVGTAHGGTRTNVVPAFAQATVDVRASTVSEAQRVQLALHALSPQVPGARLRVEGSVNRPPMERTEASGALFQMARSIAASLGHPDLQEGGTGGASDGNFTAALGTPTLDGLGPVGDGAHATHEHVEVASLPWRAALLAGLLAEI